MDQSSEIQRPKIGKMSFFPKYSLQNSSSLFSEIDEVNLKHILYLGI